MATKKSIARILVRPPARPSEGAQTIRERLDGLAKLSRINPVPRQYRMVINWGNGEALGGDRLGLVLNKPDAVRTAVNKLTALTKLRDGGVRVPEFSTDKPTPTKGVIWLARTVLGGSGGAGIKIIRRNDEVPDAPLYVKYVPKTVEYRVHVIRGAVIFAQQKKRKTEAEQSADEKLVRNYDNGWVFCPVDLEDVSEEVRSVAINSVAALGLDFGAVDLILGRDDLMAYALEVNSAPGLASPGLIEAYVEGFKEVYGSI